MHVASFRLRSIKGSPLQQGRHHETPKLPRELADDYERRTWKEKLHVTDDGHLFIPAPAFRACIVDASRYLGTQIPGKSRQTYSKHFESGLMITDNVVLNATEDDVEMRAVFGDARGKRRGPNGRVTKFFPTLLSWQGELVLYVTDDILTEEVVLTHLRAAGQFIGIGVFRPQNGGSYGQFSVEPLSWEEMGL